MIVCLRHWRDTKNEEPVRCSSEASCAVCGQIEFAPPAGDGADFGLFEMADIDRIMATNDSLAIGVLASINANVDWPGINITFKARGRKGEIGRWPRVLNYRGLLAELLLTLSGARPPGRDG